MKKGIINLAIEIDYDIMFSEEKLEALYGYTGLKTADELMKHHMGELSKKLDDVVKDLPLMRYNLTSDFLNKEGWEFIESPSFKKWVEEVESANFIDTETPEAQEAIDEFFHIELLDNALEAVSVEYGVPQLIKANSKMMDALTLKADSYAIENTIETINKYNGFPVILEGMEELFIIDYKEYGSNNVSSYSRTI